MENLKKYFWEMLGTLFIVLFGCGVAVYTNGNTVATSLAFGLVVMCMYYVTSNISGCHLNPAVTLAMLIKKEISFSDFALYIASQLLGGLLGGLLLYLFIRSRDNLGANMMQNLILFKEGITYKKDVTAYVIAMMVEIILTFVFVITIINVTKRKEDKGISGLVIGGALVLVHLLGIGLTGTSVNPARSFGVAIIQGGEALKQVWIFIIAPLIGGALAALCDKFIIEKK